MKSINRYMEDDDEKPEPKKKDIFMGMDWGQIAAVGVGLLTIATGFLASQTIFKPNIDQLLQQQQQQRMMLAQQQQQAALQHQQAMAQLQAQQQQNGAPESNSNEKELNLQQPTKRSGPKEIEEPIEENMSYSSQVPIGNVG